MPSEHQHNSVDSEYSNVYEKALDPESNLSPIPIVNGIYNKETALRAHRAAHRVDAREKYKKRIAEYIEKYSD
jgi:hypothetical protein